MKALKAVYSVLLFLTAALLVALFFVLLNIGNVTETENDLSTGIALLFAVIFTAIPTFAALPVAAGLLITLLCFLITRRKGCVLAAAIILGIFLPFLVFSLWVTLSVVISRSAVYTAVGIPLAVVYLVTFVTAIILHRKMKRDGDLQ